MNEERIKKSKIMDFNGMIEYWCSIYRPILHNMGHGEKRFYQMKPKQRIGSFVKTINNHCTPSVVVQDNTASRSPNYTIYFLSRPMHEFFYECSEDGTKQYIMDRLRDFIQWMLNKEKEGADAEIVNIVKGLCFDNVSFWSGKGNGWFWIKTRIKTKKKEKQNAP